MLKKINFILILFVALFLTACGQIDSPVTTVQKWLTASQQGVWNEASAFLVDSKLQPIEGEAYAKMFGTKFDEIFDFSVDNNIPLDEKVIKKYGVTEGYEVYAMVNSKKQGKKELKLNVIKINNEWKIVWE